MTHIDHKIAYSRWFKPLATAVGLGQGRTDASITDGTLRLRMGWAFNVQAPTDLVASATPLEHGKWWWGCGAHVIGSGRWIINGTLKNLVEIRFAQPVTAHALGSRVTVKSVLVSVSNAREFAAQLADNQAPAS